MESTAPTVTTPLPASRARTLPFPSSRLGQIPVVLLVLVLGFLALAFFPTIRNSPQSFLAYLGVATLLLGWQWLLTGRSDVQTRGFLLRTEIVRAHYVQAAVQFCIYLYWGWHTPEVAEQAPRIASQVLYLYAFGALLAWSRGREWSIGFGPLPIVFSTNLLLWFKPEWYVFQFLMISVGALGKEFVRWRRDGRTTHIFNPSVFGQVIAALLLIATGMTREMTSGEHIAFTFEKVPHFLIVLFLLGLVVQYFFAVTLMTLSAAATLCVINLVYTQVTGVYYFTTINIGATIFLGLHLLVTDPATSPRTHLGKVLFGVGYASLYSLFYGYFRDHGIPLFWDKLLPVPLLNLSVRALDRLTRASWFGALNRRWEGAWTPQRMNIAHMGVWVALFATMLGTGFVEGGHRGQSLEFWKERYDAGNERAGETYLELVQSGVANGSAKAMNLLGVIYVEGKLLEANPAAAANLFADACKLGSELGCQNVLGQFLTTKTARSPEDVELAISQLEKVPEAARDATTAFFLGVANEVGLYRERDLEAARRSYERACSLGHQEACTRLAQIEQRLQGTGRSPSSPPR